MGRQRVWAPGPPPKMRALTPTRPTERNSCTGSNGWSYPEWTAAAGPLFNRQALRVQSVPQPSAWKSVFCARSRTSWRNTTSGTRSGVWSPTGAITSGRSPFCPRRPPAIFCQPCGSVGGFRRFQLDFLMQPLNVSLYAKRLVALHSVWAILGAIIELILTIRGKWVSKSKQYSYENLGV